MTQQSTLPVGVLKTYEHIFSHAPLGARALFDSFLKREEIKAFSFNISIDERDYTQISGPCFVCIETLTGTKWVHSYQDLSQIPDALQVAALFSQGYMANPAILQSIWNDTYIRQDCETNVSITVLSSGTIVMGFDDFQAEFEDDLTEIEEALEDEDPEAWEDCAHESSFYGPALVSFVYLESDMASAHGTLKIFHQMKDHIKEWQNTHNTGEPDSSLLSKIPLGPPPSLR
jgi:hypothetical protein